MTDLQLQIAFSMVRGMHPRQAEEILSRTGSEAAFFAMSERDLAETLGASGKIIARPYRDELLERARAETEFVTRSAIRPLYFADAAYPQRMLECDDAPLMLYTLGTANLNAAHTLSIVGTRNATLYGTTFIERLVTDLSEKLDDVLIVSGLAVGCDVTAHIAALNCGIPTAGVVAHGLDMIYPAAHRRWASRMVHEGGAVLTDYPHLTRPVKGNFLARNRIVAAMWDALVVAESASTHGGALHTARLGAAYGREVFALPGRTSDQFSAGCNALIRNHTAQLCESADDIIRALGWTQRPDAPVQKTLFPELNPEQLSVIEYIRNHGEAQVNALTAALGIPVGKLMAILVDLEFKGLLMAMPGSRYRLM